jgi:hypothetical protein
MHLATHLKCLFQALETLLQLTGGTNGRHENIVTPFA